MHSLISLGNTAVYRTFATRLITSAVLCRLAAVGTTLSTTSTAGRRLRTLGSGSHVERHDSATNRPGTHLFRARPSDAFDLAADTVRSSRPRSYSQPSAVPRNRQPRKFILQFCLLHLFSSTFPLILSVNIQFRSHLVKTPHLGRHDNSRIF